jgi:hypothetical protein
MGYPVGVDAFVMSPIQKRTQMIKAKAKVPLMMTLATILCGTLLGASFTSAPARKVSDVVDSLDNYQTSGELTHVKDAIERYVVLVTRPRGRRESGGLTSQRKGTR